MSWEKYYEKNKGRPLRPLYSKAIQLIDSSAKLAADLGCGVGTEVLDLVRRGFEVHAVDREEKAIETVKAQINSDEERLHVHFSSLEKWNECPQVDFLFAYHSFPFCEPQSFDLVVSRALSTVAQKGIFAASFFGPEDEWVKENKVVGISSDEVKRRLCDFEVLHFEEIRKVGPTALQGDKMWNVIEVIACRN